MTDPRPTKTGAELLAIMRGHGISPRVRMDSPGSTIELPPPHQAAWEAAHGGRPVLSSVVAGLERRGLINMAHGRMAGHLYMWWTVKRQGNG